MYSVVFIAYKITYDASTTQLIRPKRISVFFAKATVVSASAQMVNKWPPFKALRRHLSRLVCKKAFSDCLYL